MAVLDDKKKLGPNDFVSFRVVEDRDNDSQRLRVNDNGELEVPYIGLVSGPRQNLQGTRLHDQELAGERVLLSCDRDSGGRSGKRKIARPSLCLRLRESQGPQEIPPDESYTVSKAVIRAGGFGDFANKRKVKVTRKNGKEFNVDLKRVIEEGHTEEDMVLRARRPDLCPAALDQHVGMQTPVARKGQSPLPGPLHLLPGCTATKRCSSGAGGFRF